MHQVIVRGKSKAIDFMQNKERVRIVFKSLFCFVYGTYPFCPRGDFGGGDRGLIGGGFSLCERGVTGGSGVISIVISIFKLRKQERFPNPRERRNDPPRKQATF